MRLDRAFPLLFIVPLALPACSSGTTYDNTCSTADDCGSGYACTGGECVLGSGTGGDGGGGGTGGAGGTAGVGGTGGTSSGNPRITVELPPAFNPVAGVTTIRIRVTDNDGVDDARVTALVRNEHEISLNAIGNDRYEGSFDTSVLDDPAYVLLKVRLELRAYDLAGNLGTADTEFYLDFAPPIAALQSPNVVMVKNVGQGSGSGGVGGGGGGGGAGGGGTGGTVGDTDDYVCSHAFNPLGPSAVRHGDIIQPGSPFGTIFYARARVEDQGNTGSALPPITPVAFVDPASVYLHILDYDAILADAGEVEDHVLVQGDGNPDTPADPDDAPCDTIDPDGLADSIPLDPVKALGLPDFTPDTTYADVCEILGSAESSPGDVCTPVEANNVTYWLTYGVIVDDADRAAAVSIYVYDYDEDSLDGCVGSYYDVGNLSDGPACLAVEAADNLGNHAVSQPIAICIDKDGCADDGFGFCDPSLSECDTFAAAAADMVRAACTRGCTPITFENGPTARWAAANAAQPFSRSS